MLNVDDNWEKVKEGERSRRKPPLKQNGTRLTNIDPAERRLTEDLFERPNIDKGVKKRRLLE